MNNRDCLLPILVITLISLFIGLLAYCVYQYDEWVHTNCQATEEVRTVEDYPTYVDVSGGNGIMVPVGGGSHQERAWLCPAVGGGVGRTVWLEG